MASKVEIQPSPFGNGDEALAYMKKNFFLSARHTVALMAVHSSASIVPLNIVGQKYTWFGNGYLSSFYYKLLANRPMYAVVQEHPLGIDQDIPGHNVVARGDAEGNPMRLTNWRVHCNNLWNTTDGGPCFMRPTKPSCPEDNPSSAKLQVNCFDGFDENMKRKVKPDACCQGVTFTDNGIQLGGTCDVGNSCSFRSQFGLPYELGFYNKLTYDVNTRRPLGCPGIDIPRDQYYKKPIFGSPVMHCERNDNAPEGEPVYKIVEDFADDHDVWANDFLDAWVKMTNNSDEGLVAAPQEGWLGYYSLKGKFRINFWR